MSSIPLSRILQTKKTNGELEKEQFDKQMVNNSLFSLSKKFIICICFQMDRECGMFSYSLIKILFWAVMRVFLAFPPNHDWINLWMRAWMSIFTLRCFWDFFTLTACIFDDMMNLIGYLRVSLLINNLKTNFTPYVTLNQLNLLHPVLDRLLYVL